MATKKITELPAAATITGVEVVPIVQSGATVKAVLSGLPISTAGQTALDLKAPLASPALTGTPTVPTQTVGDSSARAASTAYVQGEVTLDRTRLDVTETSLRVRGLKEIRAEAFATANPALATVTKTGPSSVGAVLLTADSPRFHFSNNQMIAVTLPGQLGVAKAAKDHAGLTTANTGYQWSVEFDYYGQVLEPYVNCDPTCLYWVWADGVPVTVAPAPFAAPSAGVFRFHRHDFGTATWRRIRIEGFGVGAAFNGVRDGNTVLVAPRSLPRAPVLGWLGDSYGDGRKATSEPMGFVRTMGRLLGVEAWQGPSHGGQGLLYAPAGAAYTHRARIATDLVPIAPDMVVIQGSVNDINASWSGNVGPEMVACIAAVKAALPNALIACTGPLFPGPGGTWTTMENQLKAAVAVAYPDVPFIQTHAGTEGEWITGTGRVGATTGDGLADVARDADNSHPTQVGHDIYARRFAGALRSAWDLA